MTAAKLPRGAHRLSSPAYTQSQFRENVEVREACLGRYYLWQESQIRCNRLGSFPHPQSDAAYLSCVHHILPQRCCGDCDATETDIRLCTFQFVAETLENWRNDLVIAFAVTAHTDT